MATVIASAYACQAFALGDTSRIVRNLDGCGAEFVSLVQIDADVDINADHGNKRQTQNGGDR